MSTISSRNGTRLPADRMRPLATSHKWQSFLEKSVITGRVADIGSDREQAGLKTSGEIRILNDAIRRKVNPKTTRRQAERASESLP